MNAVDICNEYFSMLNGQLKKPWWQTRIEYLNCKNYPKMRPKVWQNCTRFLHKYFKELEQKKGKKEKEYYLVADVGRLFFERYDNVKNWHGANIPPYTLEQLEDYLTMASAAENIPHEKKQRMGL